MPPKELLSTPGAVRWVTRSVKHNAVHRKELLSTPGAVRVGKRLLDHLDLPPQSGGSLRKTRTYKASMDRPGTLHPRTLPNLTRSAPGTVHGVPAFAVPAGKCMVARTRQARRIQTPEITCLLAWAARKGISKPRTPGQGCSSPEKCPDLRERLHPFHRAGTRRLL